MGKKNSKKEANEAQPEPSVPGMGNLPPEVAEKLKTIKKKVDSFQEKILDKFGKYIIGIALLPPKGAVPQPTAPGEEPKPPVIPEEEKDKINVLVLVDDSDSTQMPKEELKTKLTTIIKESAESVDKNIVPETVILSELWQSCFDGKYDLLQPIAMGAPVYDKGMLAAIKISEIHKTMVLKKFEKYIVSYVLAGSLTQGKATPTSDIDVWIVIDDTDVKKMTRVELKDKLRAIIIGMGMEAGEMTGIRNKINIQVYILTDFWESLKEANPVIFTLLRDGVPFFDRGIFMPWKQLLKMGKIKPSAEAIDMFLGSGEQVIRRVKAKLNEIAMEDVYYSILTPSQAALMLYGVAPPTPKETPQVLSDVFVKKEKLLEDKFVKILQRAVDVRKGIEHGDIKEVTGKEIDEYLSDGDKYLKRIKRLFTQIEKMKDEKDLTHIIDTVTTVTRDCLRAEGRERVDDSDLVKAFDHDLVSSGKLSAQSLRTFKDIMKLKDSTDHTKVDLEIIKRDAGALIRALIEHVQRKRSRDLERAKIRIKHGEKLAEVLVLGSEAFIFYDMQAEERRIEKATLTSLGGLGPTSESSLEEMEKSLANYHPTKQPMMRAQLLHDLSKLFGKDMEILLN